MNKPQIFCFTYAGGTAAFFDLIEKDLQKFELVKIEYAGHGTRYKESFYQNFKELAEDMFCQFKERYLGGNYALFGYSMGTITVIELLKRILDDHEMTKPLHVFLAAHEPHTKTELIGFRDKESDEWVKERTIKFGGVPEKLINNKSFWRMYLPLYRADYTLIGKYRFEDLDLRTAIPATIFYSESDTPRKEMNLWRKHFIGDCEYHAFQGNHFFIWEDHQEMARIIDLRMWQRGEKDDL